MHGRPVPGWCRSTLAHMMQADPHDVPWNKHLGAPKASLVPRPDQRMVAVHRDHCRPATRRVPQASGICNGGNEELADGERRPSSA